jgi:hypothetical protein
MKFPLCLPFGFACLLLLTTSACHRSSAAVDTGVDARQMNLTITKGQHQAAVEAYLTERHVAFSTSPDGNLEAVMRSRADKAGLIELLKVEVKFDSNGRVTHVKQEESFSGH